MVEALRRISIGRGVLALSALVSGSCLYAAVDATVVPPSAPALEERRAALVEPMLADYCSRCHNDFDHVAGLSVEGLKAGDIAAGRNAEAWEKILRRVAAGEMPPHSKKQPDPALRADVVAWLDEARALCHGEPRSGRCPGSAAQPA